MVSRAYVLIVILVFAIAAPATAEERFALLIGNANYAREVGPLKNPVNDVNLIAAALAGVGFKPENIRTVPNADRRTILAEVDRYADRLASAGSDAIGFFYYSGHGAANGRDRLNYLIPVDAKALDATVWYDAVKLDDVIAKLSTIASNAAHFVIFDACRNLLNMPTRGAKGFVPVRERRGMLIAFSTDPGETASDAGEGSGPYAKALAQELVKPGLDHVNLFKNVQERVFRETGAQLPWTRDGVVGRITLQQGEPPARVEASAGGVAQSPRGPVSEAGEAWRIAHNSNSCPIVASVARRFPDTFWADLARQRLAELKCTDERQVASAAPIERSPAACSGIRTEVAGKGIVCLDPADPAKREFQDCAGGFCGPQMVVVPAGSFMMGSPDSEEGRSSNEGPQRRVTIAKPIAVGKFEVTFAEWDACVSDRGCSHEPEDEGWGRGKRPVINVSWDDAKEYVAWLSQKTGQPYRLLTEAEWEYAARAGTTTPFHFGATISTDQSNYDGNYTYGSGRTGTYRQKTIEVGSLKRPNAFGVHDMHGNVWEWVEDCYADSYAKAPTDGSRAPDTNGCSRVLRGGSWYINPLVLRSASRVRTRPVNRSGSFGFRLARTLNPSP